MTTRNIYVRSMTQNRWISWFLMNFDEFHGFWRKSRLFWRNNRLFLDEKPPKSGNWGLLGPGGCTRGTTMCRTVPPYPITRVHHHPAHHCPAPSSRMDVRLSVHQAPFGYNMAVSWHARWGLSVTVVNSGVNSGVISGVSGQNSQNGPWLGLVFA